MSNEDETFRSMERTMEALRNRVREALSDGAIPAEERDMLSPLDALFTAVAPGEPSWSGLVHLALQLVGETRDALLEGLLLPDDGTIEAPEE